MLFPFLPKLTRCCFCTNNLRLACLLIVIWTMLTACHSCRILLWPLCPHEYADNEGIVNEVLLYLRWTLFFVNMYALLASFCFLLGLFFRRQLAFCADLFIFAGIFSAVAMAAHGITAIWFVLLQEKCDDISDGLAHIVYFFAWCYFILIVNSYTDEIDTP